MGNIRKQTIISSILVYIGFLVGFVNTYISGRNGSLTPEQYGLTRIFSDFGQNVYSFAALGIIPVIYKFYPYYKDNLPERKIDLISWALLISFTGFILVMICGIWFEPAFIGYFSKGSNKLLTDYYYWMFPFAIGMLFFFVTESFAWALHRSVVSNFLKETLLRVLSCILIFLFYFKVISFHTFIRLYAFQFLVLFLVLIIYLYNTGHLHFTFKISLVTRKFWKKMVTMQALAFGGTCIAAIAATVDSFIIAGFQGLGSVGVFLFAQYAANLVQVPQRSIQAVSAGVLARAWKEKDYKEINRVYERSCINLLLMALFIFGNLWLNVEDGMRVLDIQAAFSEGLGVMFVLGLIRIVDAGTGLNAMVINTSTFWKFDCMSGVVLFILRLPLTYYLIKHYGIIGSAIAELISYSIYNFIRFEFLRRKFNMQPFSMKTIYALLLALAAYLACYYGFEMLSGWVRIIARGISFSLLMVAGIFYFRITPDAWQMVAVAREKFGRNKK
ncbi:lipopolysaccharide biosynthesis protein [Sediminibacterium ginsengisoli]|uniref:Membrane protein involved in the export of O-antigen and teichoic acid n=1 Tax=Sediminibacterium ginsengisoli TaxID=413434 RepID=A0A1T4PNZ2_9BACT|nr:polysaccharide biosynthesis C-terminal domain-containing protein [Sediminibacterium ginsengisoli]SJZ92927.1 Membrane protein involved in the export of O-antigen and teichoic acid [Sediminibacterium ginsengisoli]